MTSLGPTRLRNNTNCLFNNKQVFQWFCTRFWRHPWYVPTVGSRQTFESLCHGRSEAACSPAPEAEPCSTQPALRHPNSASLGCSAALSHRRVAITSSLLATSSPESNQQRASPPPHPLPQWLTASSLPRNWFAGKMFALHDWHEIPTAPNTVSFRYKITSRWVTKLSTSQLAVSVVPVYLRNPLPRKRLRALDLTEIAYGFVTYRIASNFKITSPSEHLNV